ncbi:hypothetical protein CHU00_16540 [Sphingobacterium cellulitidis]|uniref:right-handed parallel beta-helix repeat-containing protein n=1 Tax=Sphingobacterium cellulitidis TaxID=1768011 RepID=UPI000B944772|nr:right-handed parallel beta-helix repeat-containing protein [Sphingobacterium cellulitidis]OYD44524.1 hypothetical protein CHU00_16540 [Sphingobacterium cellulitidis]
MNVIKFVFFIISFFLLTAKVGAQEQVFYVSPNGNDLNDGTLSKPWKTFNKASSTLIAGQTAIFDDGIYYETNRSTINTVGNSSKKIKFMAKNKGQAKLIFSGDNSASTKILIKKAQYVVLDGFVITQKNKASENMKDKGLDIFIYCLESHNIQISNNVIYNSYEDGIKGYKSKNLVIENNIVKDIFHEGIDFVNVNSSIIKDNTVIEVQRIGIMVKGGSRDIQITDNSVINESKTLFQSGISVGDMTGKNSTYNKSGFEIYRTVVYNNKVISKKQNVIKNGISFIGGKDINAYNNYIEGAIVGFRFMNAKGRQNGWDWDPINDNLTLANNTFANIGREVYLKSNTPTRLSSDYNVFYNSPKGPKEVNSSYLAKSDSDNLQSVRQRRFNKKVKVKNITKEVDKIFKNSNLLDQGLSTRIKQRN